MSGQKIKLSPLASSLHQQLKQQLVEQIQQNHGVICFSEFMQQVLYTPSLGYYQNELRKFGEQGDFITAPEMGNIFAQCIAQSVNVVLSQSDRDLLEIGAGSGVLAADLLKTLSELNRLPQHYFILETSASLQSLQKQTLAQCVPDLLERVVWLACLPTDFSGVIIANEVVDAMPCHRIQMTAKGWQYLGVAYRNSEFVWQLNGAVEHHVLPAVLQQSENYIEGYTTEIRPLLKGWINSLADSILSANVILFDYGYPQHEYYHPQRTQGSLQCFSRHQAHSQALDLVGLQDITAHVDFTQLAQFAVDAGFCVEGFTTQMGYLLENGALAFADTNKKQTDGAEETSHIETEKQMYQYSQQIQKLTAPGQMGEVVKVILLNQSMQEKAEGFQFQEHLCRL